MELLDGRVASAHILQELAEKVVTLKAAGKRPPHLAAMLVGHNGASETYVASKIKRCAEIGYNSTLVRFEDTVTEAEILAKIEEINLDPEIDGLIVQLPLPDHIDANKVTLAISPSKDVDGFHPENLGRVAKNLAGFIAATPLGILRLIEFYNIETSGKHAVVIGRSQIVGLPMSILLQRADRTGNATVTITHSKTKDLPSITRQADILIAAMGRPGFVTADMVKAGAVVIDVGLTRVEDTTKKSGFRLAGDVDFDAVAPKASYITPVPGGVGLMTICGLLENTMRAYVEIQ
jgi:methylenetetrahydrofolate dehydrogenase (NADP+)/methenyltetrahydrofolate cyclohydrolase